MQPPPHAERIISDVAGQLDVDLSRLVPQVAAELSQHRPRGGLIEAETLAMAALEPLWESEIAVQCEAALAGAHVLGLEQAQYVLEARDDLGEHLRDSWIARAVMHDLAFRLAWDVLDAEGLLEELPLP